MEVDSLILIGSGSKVAWLKSLGESFLHNPFGYLLLLFFSSVIVVVAYLRIRNERRNFSFRIYDRYQSLRSYFLPGIIAGISMSFVSVGAGLFLSKELVFVLSVVAIFSMCSLAFQWSSASIIFGSTSLIYFIAQPFTSFFQNTTIETIASLAILGSLLMYAESWLLSNASKKPTFPTVVVGKRGKKIGMHFINPIWLLPLFVVTPGTTVTEVPSFWPFALSLPNGFTLIFVPLILGAVLFIRGSYPKEAIAQVARELRLFSILLLVVAIIGYFVHPVLIVWGIVAVVGRILLHYRKKLLDEDMAPIFTNNENGLTILGVLPNSPAEKLDIQVGEKIIRVNGFTVHTEEEFYTALAKNRAQCKLEIMTQNGEVRFVNRATYADEHHEMGFIWVPETKGEKMRASS